MGLRTKIKKLKQKYDKDVQVGYHETPFCLESKAMMTDCSFSSISFDVIMIPTQSEENRTRQYLNDVLKQYENMIEQKQVRLTIGGGSGR